MNWRIYIIAIMYCFLNRGNMDRIYTCGCPRLRTVQLSNYIFRIVPFPHPFELANSSAYNVGSLQSLLDRRDELNLAGNCLKGSRPILSFNSAFDETPSSRLIKEMIIHVRILFFSHLISKIFGVPPKARKSKPFIDHTLSFTLADNKIWFRNYQIQEKQSTEKNSDTDIALLEIGPRFVLTPIIIFEGSFSGPV